MLDVVWHALTSTQGRLWSEWYWSSSLHYGWL